MMGESEPDGRSDGHGRFRAREQVGWGVWLAVLLSVLSGCGREADKPAPQSPAPNAEPVRASPAAKASQPPPMAAAPEPAALPPTAAAPASAEDLRKHGGELYGRICAVCHGANGEGYLADQAPRLAHPEYLATVSDEFLTSAIANGRAGSVMSPWSKRAGGPLSDADVEAVIAFMRSWPQQQGIELDQARPRGAMFTGASIFARECASCHGPKGPHLRLLNPQLLEHASAGFLRYAIHHGRSGTPMPAFSEKLGQQGVEDVVAYLMAYGQSPAMQKAGVTVLPEPIKKGEVVRNPRGPQPTGFNEYPTFTPVATVARELTKKKARMALLDARAPADYGQEHIAGAVNVPFYDPAPYFSELPKDTWLVCYCGCPHAESGALAQKLQAAGFSKVTVLDEGLWDWKNKGHPMRNGPKP
jgi:cytochrome c oxidase cbb3-type subunit 3